MARFSLGIPVSSKVAQNVPNVTEGWIIGQERKGVLLVGDDQDDVTQAVVYIPKLDVCFMFCLHFAEHLFVLRVPYATFLLFFL